MRTANSRQQPPQSLLAFFLVSSYSKKNLAPRTPRTFQSLSAFFSPRSPQKACQGFFAGLSRPLKRGFFTVATAKIEKNRINRQTADFSRPLKRRFFKTSASPPAPTASRKPNPFPFCVFFFVFFWKTRDPAGWAFWNWRYHSCRKRKKNTAAARGYSPEEPQAQKQRKREKEKN